MDQRIKRTQRDYSLAFKVSLVEAVEKGELTYKQAQQRYGIQGRSTVLVWLRKYGLQDWADPSGRTRSRQAMTDPWRHTETAHRLHQQHRRPIESQRQTIRIQKATTTRKLDVQHHQNLIALYMKHNLFIQSRNGRPACQKPRFPTRHPLI